MSLNLDEYPSVRTSTPSSAPVHSGTGTAFPMPNNFMQAAMVSLEVLNRCEFTKVAETFESTSLNSC